MGSFIAQRLVKLLIAAERPVKGAKIGILGITFKENVPDLRNSRVPDIVAELRDFGIAALVADTFGDLYPSFAERGIDWQARAAAADAECAAVLPLVAEWRKRDRNVTADERAAIDRLLARVTLKR